MNNLLDKLKKYDIDMKYYIPYGNNKGKIDLSILNTLNKKDGKLILLTSVTPTPAGEGKTTLSIGLNDAFNLLNKKSIVTLREPSMGPVFGLKGGATGGGMATLEPEENINLHFNGDFHAITSAHNLLSSLIDNHIYHGNKLNIEEVIWPRTMDINDRSLRKIKTTLREDKFVITAASEIMAILALSRDIDDLKQRLENILIGFDNNKNFIYAKDIGGINALVLLLKEAINPNVVLSKEGNLAVVHTGPFGNIAHGSNSIIATNLSLKLADYVITEAGFGSDLGMEKFIDVKMLEAKKNINLVVLVTTIHSLKYHGGLDDYHSDNLEALKEGIKNLEKHIENIKSFNLDFIVAINKHNYNKEEEINFLINYCKNNGYKVEVSSSFDEGAKGSVNLAKLIINEIDNKEASKITRPYALEDSPTLKIKKLAKTIYGASDVIFSKKATLQLNLYHDLIKNLPVIVAKTHSSISGNSSLRGRPLNFILEINEIRPQMGAKFFVALTKGINTMPGLNDNPRALSI